MIDHKKAWDLVLQSNCNIVDSTNTYSFEQININAKEIIKPENLRISFFINHFLNDKLIKIAQYTSESHQAITIDDIIICYSYANIGATIFSYWKTILKVILDSHSGTNEPFGIAMIWSLIGKTDYYINQYFAFEVIKVSDNQFSFKTHRAAGHAYFEKSIKKEFLCIQE